MNGVSAYVTVLPRAAGAPAISETSMPAFVVTTQAGVDATPTGADYKNGLLALETEPEPATVEVDPASRLRDTFGVYGIADAQRLPAEERARRNRIYDGYGRR